MLISEPRATPVVPALQLRQDRCWEAKHRVSARRKVPTMDIETVHELLDQLETTIQIIAVDDREWIDPTEAGELCLIVGEVTGWGTGSAYYDELPRLLGIRPVTLRKFHKLTGQVLVSEARALADRLRSYLRALDQNSSNKGADDTENRYVAAIEPKLSFQATQWVSVPPTIDLKQKIHTLSRILDDILLELKRSNNAPEDIVFSELDRQQLIALLQTTLSVLKSPIVEKGLLLKTREALQKAAVSAAEKQAQHGFETLASHGVSWLSDLLRSFFPS